MIPLTCCMKKDIMDSQYTNQRYSTAGDPEKTNLDNWNDRLDENLEPEEKGDEEADEKAADYSERNGSGDQSDED